MLLDIPTTTDKGPIELRSYKVSLDKIHLKSQNYAKMNSLKFILKAALSQYNKCVIRIN